MDSMSLRWRAANSFSICSRTWCAMASVSGISALQLVQLIKLVFMVVTLWRWRRVNSVQFKSFGVQSRVCAAGLSLGRQFGDGFLRLRRGTGQQPKRANVLAHRRNRRADRLATLCGKLAVEANRHGQVEFDHAFLHV